MRKALKLCLALAMTGAMAIGTAFAGDTEVVVSGEALYHLKMKNEDYSTNPKDPAHKDAEKKTYSSTDALAEGILTATATNKGEVWTTKAAVGIAVKSNKDDGKGVAVKTDELNVNLSNDTFSINFGTDDLGDATKNPGYYEGDKMDAGDELSKGGENIVFEMPEIGLGALIALTNANNVQKTAYGVSYDKVFGDIDLSLEYETLSTEIDKDKGASSGDKDDNKDGVNDGSKATDYGIGVKYSMDPFAVMFNYGATTQTKGGKVATGETGAGDSYKSVDDVNMMLAADYKIDDISGVSLVYQSLVKTDNQAVVDNKIDAIKTTVTRTGLGYATKLNAVDIDVYYSMESTKRDKDGTLSSGTPVNDADWKTNILGVRVFMGF